MNYTEKLNSNFQHFEAIADIMRKTGFPQGGGSYMIDGYSLSLNQKSLAKQELVYNYIQRIDSPKILEIGFYAGHSSLIFFLANQNTKVLTIDTCDYELSIPCYDYLKQHFDIQLIKGNSHDALLNVEGKYNVLHVDGCHDLEHAKKDFMLAKRYLEPGALVIWDDWDGFVGKIDDLYQYIQLVEVANCPNPCAIFKCIE